ncbi:OmpA family protein [Azospirillum sp. RWY-5-1]|uniref:OmpA family protein n=1 Tax=Azospirillum oleiclasticum TaxID=2735135 RepID=A0ABX2TL26_9PROT|nr:OmpA family protein [Azospirillum oleiclasticum]NYZ16306.1 OmpA family protein [Azospirillum oleiclasticum]NYZ23793.1 OmpA family protein [Azospirillum oleiclasticum]
MHETMSGSSRLRICRLVVTCAIAAGAIAAGPSRAQAQSGEVFGETVYFQKSPGVQALVSDWTGETQTIRWFGKTPVAALAEKELVVRGGLNILPTNPSQPEPRPAVPTPPHPVRHDSVQRPAHAGCGNKPAAGKKYGFAIEFEFAKSDIRPDGARMLDDIGQALAAAPNVRMIIAGHTDSVGGPDYNCALSRLRAEATKAYLIDRFGIGGDRLEVRWYGMSDPLQGLPESDGRNRRVDFQKVN